jgi:hypothetical protein
MSPARSSGSSDKIACIKVYAANLVMHTVKFYEKHWSVR